MALDPPPVIDVQYRVIASARRRRWLVQLPHECDRVAFFICALSPAALLMWPLLSLRNEAFIVAALLCSAGCLISSEWKRLGIAGLLVASLLATAGCGKSEPSSRATSAQLSGEMSASDTSIREATRYRDPRLGYTPKRIDLIKGEATGGGNKDAIHAD